MDCMDIIAGMICRRNIMIHALELVICGSGCLSAQMTQKQACAKFSPAVVGILAGGVSEGTGFLVSPDGYVLTALHVVREENGTPYSAIDLTLSDGSHALAQLIPPTVETVGKDFAILKIEAKKPLPFLRLGSVNDISIGDDATIIGFPFSAYSYEGKNLTIKFCLTASLAAVSSESRQVSFNQNSPQGVAPHDENVPVNIVYFQGTSVKGVSGSPVISRETGNVVGIVSTKLTGITKSLEDVKTQVAQARTHGVVTIMGVNSNEAIGGIIQTLDTQLANGLGSATGIDDPKESLRRLRSPMH
jgi:hypothetical protein